MAVVSTNEYLLNEMKALNSSLNAINYDSATNIMTFKNHSVNVSNFNIAEIYSDYSQLKADIEVMNPEDLYNAIAINVAIKEKEKRKSINTQNSIEEIKKVNTKIKNLSLIKKTDELGTEKKYIHITTSDGANHILYDREPKDVLLAFKNLAIKNGNNYENITEEDLYEELKRNMDELSLVDSKDAQTRSDLSEDFKNKLNTMEDFNNQYANNDGSRVLGNDEHDIYIQNGQVVTYSTLENGNIVRENHTGAKIDTNENSMTDDIESPTLLEDNIINVDVSKLIDVSEYINIIEGHNELNNEDYSKINFFEGFMANLYAYKDYLGVDALTMWDEYEHYIIITSSLSNYTNKQQNAIDSYNNIVTNTKNVELKNANTKALILEREVEIARRQANKENIAGTVNALFVVETTIFISITLAAIIYFIAK